MAKTATKDKERAEKRKRGRVVAQQAIAGNRVLRRAEAEAFTGYKPTQFDEMMERDAVPRPIMLSERAVGWLESELMAWRQFKVAERDGTTACTSWREFAKQAAT